ncbi:MAG: alpha/beta hydrolase [Halioglobus sp.]
MDSMHRPEAGETHLLSALLGFLLLVSVEAIGEPAIESHLTGSRGCTVNYQIHEPERATAAPPIILTHGFMRNLDTLTGWGTQLSALGFPVVLVSLCNSSWLNGRHQANADDLVAVRHQLGFNSVIYSGFSAGGLSAYLAALNDESTAGYVGLDAVDSGNMAQDSLADLQVPALFVTAPASMCNAGGNFKQVMARSPSYDVVALSEPNHCSFEMPNDKRCNWVCGRSSESQTATAQHQIFSAVTNWLQLNFSDAAR